MSRFVELGGKGCKLTWHWSRYFRKLVGCLLIFFLMLAVANRSAAAPPNLILAGRPALVRSQVLRTTLRVRERLGSLSRSNQPDSKDEVRRLNSKIKDAGSENELIGILDEKVDATFLDPIHASTAYHKLAGFAQVKGSLQPGCANSPALERLQARTKDFIKQKQMQSWAVANLFWAMPILLDALPTVTELIPDMVNIFPARARSMNARDLSNSVLAAAKLKDVAPDDVRKIVGALATQVPGKAGDMNPQGLSNSFWASARLKDLAFDETLKMVQALAARIPGKSDDFKPQELSNCLWAAGQLKDVAPHAVVKIFAALVAKLPGKATVMSPQDLANSLQGLVFLQDFAEASSVPTNVADIQKKFLRLAASQISDMLPKLSGSDLYLSVPVVVWACGRFGLFSQPLLAAAAQRFGASAKLSSLPDWGVCALTWSYQTLDSAGQFGDFQEVLEMDVAKRELSEVDVERSKDGHYEAFWNISQ